MANPPVLAHRAARRWFWTTLAACFFLAMASHAVEGFRYSLASVGIASTLTAIASYAIVRFVYRDDPICPDMSHRHMFYRCLCSLGVAVTAVPIMYGLELWLMWGTHPWVLPVTVSLALPLGFYYGGSAMLQTEIKRPTYPPDRQRHY